MAKGAGEFDTPASVSISWRAGVEISMMRRALLSWGLTAVGLAVGIPGLDAREAPYRRPGYNVLLISLDTLRSDHLGVYGYKKNTSPNIDRFAGKGLTFLNSFSHAGWTLPSHMSIMTSLYPSIHGVTDESKALAPGIPTLAEALREQGYRTGAFTAGYLVSKSFGFDRGFEVYKEDYHYGYETPGQGWRLEEVGNSAAYWLRGHAGERFFAFIHCYDTHEPFLEHPYLREFEAPYEGKLKFLNSHREFVGSAEYAAHKDKIPGVFTINLYYSEVINKKLIPLEPRDREHIIALYDNEIRYVDYFFGKLLALLDDLRLTEKTIIVLLSDHGEELFERGSIQHGGMLYEELMRVPLIISIPGYSGPQTSAELAQGIDVAPTILDILGVKPAKGFMGISLFTDKNRFVLGQVGATNVVRTRDYKLMGRGQAKDSMLFDLMGDPAETVNIAGSLPAKAAELFTIGDRALSRRDGVKPDDARLTKKEIERLKSLGYIR